MKFEDAYEGWTSTRLTQIDAAQLLGVCPRTFRRTPATARRAGFNRYEEDGLDGLIDKRLAQVSHRRAPVDEVMCWFGVASRYSPHSVGSSTSSFRA